MNRSEIIQLCESTILPTAAMLFGTSQECMSKFSDYEGCANLVYQYELDSLPRVLRISYRSDRPEELIRAELHFVNYLSENGVRVAKPISSINGRLLEIIHSAGISFMIVSFEKGRGMRVPDNHYRYREGIPINEYFQNWGQVLGKMHRLTKSYQPISETIKRPEWYTWEYYRGFPFTERLPVISQKYHQLIIELQALPKDVDSYGLIHNDFNDGNFTVDYENGDITVFDFDDCCYFWFMYDLACAWEGGIGRVQSHPLPERVVFMDRYMEQVMTGYTRENSLSVEWFESLPLFIRLIQMQELMYYAQYLDEPDEELQAGLRYKMICIEQDIPYMGFFGRIFDPSHPFSCNIS
jgi:Ser/Thr protein kinase RdoA (MazF antagonist)